MTDGSEPPRNSLGWYLRDSVALHWFFAGTSVLRSFGAPNRGNPTADGGGSQLGCAAFRTQRVGLHPAPLGFGCRKGRLYFITNAHHGGRSGPEPGSCYDGLWKVNPMPFLQPRTPRGYEKAGDMCVRPENRPLCCAAGAANVSWCCCCIV